MNGDRVTTDYLIEAVFEGLDIDDPVQIDALTNAEVLTAEPVEPVGLRSRLTAVAAHKDAAQALFSFVEAVLSAVPTAVPVAIDVRAAEAYLSDSVVSQQQQSASSTGDEPYSQGRIVLQPGRMFGQATFGDTRLPVEPVVDTYLKRGLERVLLAWDYLTETDIKLACWWAWQYDTAYRSVLHEWIMDYWDAICAAEWDVVPMPPRGNDE